MRSILVFGDSNSWGARPLEQPGALNRFGHADRWPNVMGGELGAQWEVLNESLCGRTTLMPDTIMGGPRAGIEMLQGVLECHVPLDLVILMLGTNDLKARFGLRAHNIRRGIERLGDMVAAFAPDARIAVMRRCPSSLPGCWRLNSAMRTRRKQG